MIVTTKVKMDILSKGVTPRIDAVQGDTNTRALELKLYAQGKVWEVPADVTVGLRYRKSDGTGGVYDTLPDGTRAWQIQGNTVTLILAPQMLTAAGQVHVQAELLSGGDSLATFEIRMDVARNVAAGIIKSENYVNMRAWLLNALNTALEQAMQDGAFTPDISVGTVTTLQPGSAAAAYFAGTAKAPVLNLGIPAGYTPQKGVDYWTEADQAEMQAAVEEALYPQIAARLQQSPGFADSTEDCTDTEKLYVLPDGYIYAYMQATGANYTNLIDTIGYNDGQYCSAAAFGTDSACVATNEFAYDCSADAPPTIYVKGVQWTTANTHCRIVGLMSDLTIGSIQITSSDINPDTDSTLWDVEVLGDNYYKFTPSLNADGKWEYGVNNENAKNVQYLRMSFVGTGADLILTLDEPIEEGVAYKWVNTGLAFVPADYEDRIIALEEDNAGQEERLSGLESGGVPSYVCEEAERVADLALSKRTAKSLVFAALSDVHYPYDDASDGDADTEQSMLHAGMGIAQIRRHMPLDFVGLFGDYVKGGGSSTVAESKAALKFVHGAMYEAGLGVQQIWMQGNHDRNPYDTDDGDLTDDELYAYIFAHNAGTAVDNDNPQRGYGYRDFDAQKTRVVYWNSSDISGAATVTDHMISAAQYRWMADTAFDLSGKDAPSEWGIVMLSHMPVNWSTQLTAFVDAYISGTGATVTAADAVAVTVDFAGKNQAEFICAVNGHTHNFRCSQVGTNGFWQIAVPQICAGRYNEYGISWPDVGGEVDENGDPVYYYKTADSAESTSFCLFLIDRKNRKIHALHYGAGIDRELNY